ncbi:hypothetical protein SUGI_0478920 [Cryptomeria japonica]|nr:hypothetical protein SUGI_0478920 [Cryptomeria japonica]
MLVIVMNWTSVVWFLHRLCWWVVLTKAMHDYFHLGQLFLFLVWLWIEGDLGQQRRQLRDGLSCGRNSLLLVGSSQKVYMVSEEHKSRVNIEEAVEILYSLIMTIAMV